MPRLPELFGNSDVHPGLASNSSLGRHGPRGGSQKDIYAQSTYLAGLDAACQISTECCGGEGFLGKTPGAGSRTLLQKPPLMASASKGWKRRVLLTNGPLPTGKLK